jgi:uncharacterized protein (DUF1697 family)
MARPSPTTTYVGFIRAVMLGRDGLHRATLLDVCAAAGAVDPVSYLTTGNISFRARPSSVGRIRARLERGIGEVVGRRTEVFVRDLDELLALRALDPFRRPPLKGACERIVAFLDHEPVVALPIWSPSKDAVVYAAGPRELFSVAAKQPDGTSRGSGGLVERATGTRVTSRAWSTVERIVAKLT